MTTQSDRQPEGLPNTEGPPGPRNRINGNDYPPRKNRWAVLERVVDKLTGRQLFLIIIAMIVAYCLLNWSN